VRQRGWRRLVKRAVDVTVASSVLVATAPVMLGAAGAIMATMGRPVLFRQERVGQGGRIIQIAKLRTMKAAAPEASPDQDHLRITPLGQWLRDTSIDELPQLFSVIRGDMSLVGPRPLLVRYLGRYSAEQMRRHDVLPGLTGWAQVNGRNSLSWSEKFALDVWYVDHWSLRLDGEILVRTAAILLRREGVSAAGHATMPEFVGSSP
jgi:lipopolysaccharide/colanic/teichoic acid biosynthesis glycosyltransferase